MKPLASIVVLLALSQVALAQAEPAKPQGTIESGVVVSDPDFHVGGTAIGLERRVEMLQWQRADSPAPLHYVRAWVAGVVDSSRFDARHRNPGDLPFNGARWWTTQAKLDGHPVDAAVLGALDAWTPIEPDPARLPANLAASFQPDGDGLSTSQDPRHPQIGDVRVRWRQIVTAAAPVGIVLIDGRWDLPENVAVVGTNPVAVAATPTPAPAASWWSGLFGTRLPWLIGAGVLLALAMIVRWRNR